MGELFSDSFDGVPKGWDVNPSDGTIQSNVGRLRIGDSGGRPAMDGETVTVVYDGSLPCDRCGQPIRVWFELSVKAEDGATVSTGYPVPRHDACGGEREAG